MAGAGAIWSRAPNRRNALELGLLVAAGLTVGALSPWGSDAYPLVLKHAYWLTTVLGGGVIGIALDETVGRRIAPPWRRVLAVSLLMTPLTALYVLGAIRVVLGHWDGWSSLGHLIPQVFPIALPIMAVRALVWRPVRVETRTVIEPPLPQAEAAFRRRLSARRRAARLIAIEAHDHYLRVHTDAGAELVTLRFADALAELDKAHGYRVHRSWWVAADAIEAVRWRKGAGEATLAGGLVAPVSRSMAPALREAGWR
ncbi:MAG: LytTR family DNA-binding domain-containing protein [Caulobacter sp.]|nr:LytTR family DNA-binding domain-containing protein [Caulobacter sp.]